MDFLADNRLLGLLIGLATFLVIGTFHPIVIKAEYYRGKRCWWIFLIAGIAALAASALVSCLPVSIILGVVGFSCFWSILELFQQEKRVRKGWFPRNPKRHYPWDHDHDETKSQPNHNRK